MMPLLWVSTAKIPISCLRGYRYSLFVNRKTEAPPAATTSGWARVGTVLLGLKIGPVCSLHCEPPTYRKGYASPSPSLRPRWTAFLNILPAFAAWLEDRPVCSRFALSLQRTAKGTLSALRSPRPRWTAFLNILRAFAAWLKIGQLCSRFTQWFLKMLIVIRESQEKDSGERRSHAEWPL